MLSHEHEQRRRLEDMVEQLARQHSHLEQAAQQQQHKPQQQGGASLHAHSIHSEEDEDNEFFDAEEDEIKADFIVQVPIGHRRTPSANSQASEGRNAGENTQDSESDAEDTTISVITRRNTSTVVTNKQKIFFLIILYFLINFLFLVQKETLSPSVVATMSGGGENGSVAKSTRRPRRTRVPDKPNYPLNLWSIMKNCIGKDLSKIPMPVSCF